MSKSMTVRIKAIKGLNPEVVKLFNIPMYIRWNIIRKHMMKPVKVSKYAYEYTNEFGVTFELIRENANPYKQYELVFRDMFKYNPYDLTKKKR